MLIVFGLVAFDNAYAILQTFPHLFPTCAALPSPLLLIHALLVPLHQYDEHRIQGLVESLERLRRKSRSFYLASAFFPGRLRVDLMLLYSFCRVADDLVDEATSTADARRWIDRLHRFLELSYSPGSEKDNLREFVTREFPVSAHSALLLLPISRLSPAPLFDMLRGFEIDLQFPSFPVGTESDLRLYSARVAGTVAESCLELVYHHSCQPVDPAIIKAGGEMGIALQYINIARDIAVDAAHGRAYLPADWLGSCRLQPADVVSDPDSPEIDLFRQRLLDKAMTIYTDCRGAIERLPSAARAPIRVAVENYVEIGRMLRQPGHQRQAGRATVPKLRRLRVALGALWGPG